MYTLLVLIPLPALSQLADSCTCDREALLDNVRTADHIFYGSIEEASMSSASSKTIDLSLKVREPIRGPESGMVQIATTLPHECGVSARIGDHALFVIGTEQTVITRCGGSGRHDYPMEHELWDLHYLHPALLVVEHSDENRATTERQLNRFFGWTGATREDMDRFFALLVELDPQTTLHTTKDTVIYRNLAFQFDGTKLVNWKWLGAAL